MMIQPCNISFGRHPSRNKPTEQPHVRQYPQYTGQPETDGTRKYGESRSAAKERRTAEDISKRLKNAEKR